MICKFRDLKINYKFPSQTLSFRTKLLSDVYPSYVYSSGDEYMDKRTSFEKCDIVPYMKSDVEWDYSTSPQLREDPVRKTHDLSRIDHGDEKLFDVDSVAVRYTLEPRMNANEDAVLVLKKIRAPKPRRSFLDDDDAMYFTLRSFVEEVLKHYQKDYQYFLPESCRLYPENPFKLCHIEANLFENIVDLDFV